MIATLGVAGNAWHMLDFLSHGESLAFAELHKKLGQPNKDRRKGE